MPRFSHHIALFLLFATPLLTEAANGAFAIPIQQGFFEGSGFMDFILRNDGSTQMGAAQSWKPLKSEALYKSYSADYAEVAVSMKDKTTFDHAIAVNRSGSLPYLGRGDVINVTKFYAKNKIGSQTTCLDNQCYTVTVRACNEILKQSGSERFEDLDYKQSQCADLAETFNKALALPDVKTSLDDAFNANFDSYNKSDVGRGSVFEKLAGRDAFKKNRKKIDLQSINVLSKYLDACKRIAGYNSSLDSVSTSTAPTRDEKISR